MNIYRLQYRERGFAALLDIYNILAEDLEGALAIGHKHAAKRSPGMEVECCGVAEIARDVITSPRTLKKTA
jgi:hypothetical protein